VINFSFVYPNLNQETVSAIKSFIPILLFIPLVKTSNAVCGNVLRAGGDGKWQMKVHVYTQWLITLPITVIFIYVFKLSVTWVFFLLLFDELIKLLPFHLRIKKGIWMKKLVDVKASE